MRLIDADELLKAVDKEREYLLARGQTGAEHILVHNFRNLIDEAPTLEVFAYTKNGVPLTRAKPSETLIDKAGPVFEQITETATNFFEDETISGLLKEGENEEKT